MTFSKDITLIQIALLFFLLLPKKEPRKGTERNSAQKQFSMTRTFYFNTLVVTDRVLQLNRKLYLHLPVLDNKIISCCCILSNLLLKRWNKMESISPLPRMERGYYFIEIIFTDGAVFVHAETYFSFTDISLLL